MKKTWALPTRQCVPSGSLFQNNSHGPSIKKSQEDAYNEPGGVYYTMLTHPDDFDSAYIFPPDWNVAFMMQHSTLWVNHHWALITGLGQMNKFLGDQKGGFTPPFVYPHQHLQGGHKKNKLPIFSKPKKICFKNFENSRHKELPLQISALTLLLTKDSFNWPNLNHPSWMLMMGANLNCKYIPSIWRRKKRGVTSLISLRSVFWESAARNRV